MRASRLRDQIRRARHGVPPPLSYTLIFFGAIIRGFGPSARGLLGTQKLLRRRSNGIRQNLPANRPAAFARREPHPTSPGADMTIDCRRRQLALGLAAAAATGWTPGAWAQGSTPFPSKPVMLIVPNAPGGAIDILARVMQQQLQTLWNQTVIVEYKAGAGTTVGTDFTAKAQPNGYTLCPVATPHVINPALRQLPYDTVKDLSGITILGVSNILISANPNFPANNLKDAIAVIQKSPGKYSYASPGSGSSMHLAMELLKQSAGLDILHVPFKGSGPAYPEVMSGRIDLLVDPLFS